MLLTVGFGGSAATGGTVSTSRTTLMSTKLSTTGSGSGSSGCSGITTTGAVPRNEIKESQILLKSAPYCHLLRITQLGVR
ncbi:hypothetical protein Bhyg_04144 [Pseudolycoriella hygida]|uniref:Uncharacterized protein n=1 Tax=Pseudolycoriella hygida TaxID=35572 RepID=A0A9Q0NFI5_9DIPT|nr:hypothetical protein Bhyg_04144 [Pseudolycoriella hygida]